MAIVGQDNVWCETRFGSHVLCIGFRATSIERRFSRAIINLQDEFSFEPSNLKITNAYYAKYEAMSTILDQNPGVLALIHADIKKPLKYSFSKTDDDKFKYTTDNLLRILICQAVEGGSLRGTVIRIDDSNFLRRFVRIHNGPMMDFSTLDYISPDEFELTAQLTRMTV